MDKDPRAEASLPQRLLCAGPASESLCPLLPRTPYDTFTDGILGPTETLATLSIVEVKRGFRHKRTQALIMQEGCELVGWLENLLTPHSIQ